MRPPRPTCARCAPTARSWLPPRPRPDPYMAAVKVRASSLRTRPVPHPGAEDRLGFYRMVVVGGHSEVEMGDDSEPWPLAARPPAIRHTDALLQPGARRSGRTRTHAPPTRRGGGGWVGGAHGAVHVMGWRRVLFESEGFGGGHQSVRLGPPPEGVGAPVVACWLRGRLDGGGRGGDACT